ncbi:hypothetical protein MNV49_001490 [Pseudohyphozyma bogoriensis]|nr:hypothetical protein MNV49_001490 [Pseudohyphozyma bogoriensis]
MITIPNPIKGDGGARTVQLVTEFIVSQLALHRQAATSKASGTVVPPLFVGVQGPQGCGKSHLTALLPAALCASPHSLRVASLSLDDLYSPHATLTSLAEAHPTNKLIQGRGQPGTHDLALAKATFDKLRNANESEAEGVEISLPVYDKSRFGGRGDRSEEVVKVTGPFDVVIFEGWMNGFYPIGSSSLASKYAAASKDPKAYAKEHLGYDEPFFLAHKEADLEFVDAELGKYCEGLWSFVDCFVQLKPVEMNYVWQWRLQQEHAMKAKNGGLGMTDEEVMNFIARYMPGYELFLDGIQSPDAPWHRKGLKLIVGREREIVGTETF